MTKRSLPTGAIECSYLPMARTLTRLFEEQSPETLKGEDRLAFDATVVLRGLNTPLSGSLSYTDEGGLKLLTPIPNQPGKFIEQFFTADDLMLVAVTRSVSAEESSGLWTPS